MMLLCLPTAFYASEHPYPFYGVLLITSNTDQQFVPYNPISLYGKKIHFSDEAEHVGIIRSTSGNLPHLLNRIVTHKKASGGVLFPGIACNHRANLVASIKVEKLYGMPVLFSGVATLV